VLFDLLHTAKAWEMLHDPEIAGMCSPDEFLDLAKAAGCSEDEAQKAASNHAWAKMQKDVGP
jgi:hypothetical protein